MPPLAAKLTPLTASLTAALLQALSYPQNHKEAVKKLIALLIRLDAGAAARMTYLAARTETARRLVRMIRFDGHIGTYINDLSTTIFTVIKHTADWFLASFKENEVASSELLYYDLSVVSLFDRLRRMGKEPDRNFCGDVQDTGILHRCRPARCRRGSQYHAQPKSQGLCSAFLIGI
jgi:hypothetical protein